MSTRYSNGSHYQNHQRAAELHDNAAHTHRVAEQNGQQDHLTGHEHSRQALEHSEEAHHHSQGIAPFGHEEIAVLAHQLWQARGHPYGSPQQDWFQAAEKLRSRAESFPKKRGEK
jgi:hypothetical protein